jgi:hypothetical protein
MNGDALLERARALGFPDVTIAPATRIIGGEATWRVACHRGTEEMHGWIDRALAKLESAR